MNMKSITMLFPHQQGSASKAPASSMAGHDGVSCLNKIPRMRRPSSTSSTRRSIRHYSLSIILATLLLLLSSSIPIVTGFAGTGKARGPIKVGAMKGATRSSSSTSTSLFQFGGGMMKQQSGEIDDLLCSLLSIVQNY